MDIMDVYPDKVMPVTESGCWLWLGGCKDGGRGYGTIGHSSKAHIESYKLSFGDTRKSILHTCDVPSCVNPKHLYAGSSKQNAQDRERRGRRKKLLGSAHGMAKLTEAQVIEIRESYRKGGISQRELAREFSVSQALVFYILKGSNWKHV